MPIQQTNLHIGYVVDQIRQNLIGLQRDVNHNAQTHKAMALAGSPDLKTLQAFINDSIASYQKRLKWFDDWIAVNQKQTELSGQLAKMGWNLNDITVIQNGISVGVSTFANAKRDSSDAIVSACNQLMSDVDDPESLWPQ